MLDVAAPALHEVAGELSALGLVPGSAEILGQRGEALVEQPEQRAEGSLLSAVRRGGHQDEVAALVRGQSADELVALVAGAGGRRVERAGVRLVDDHELRTGAQELLAAAVALDEVGGDDHVRIEVEDRLPDRAVALQARGGGSQHGLRVDVELRAQLLLPLLGQMRWTQDGKPARGALVEQLARDAPGRA